MRRNPLPPRVEDYLDIVCSQIRFREAHPEIRRELAGHFEDIIEGYVAEGLDAAEAVERAVQQMGNPEIVGRQLNEAHRPQFDWQLFTSVALLTLLGLWAMYAVEVSASTPIAGTFRSKLLWSVAGLAAGALLFSIDYRPFLRFSWQLFLLTSVVVAFVAFTLPQYIPYLDLTTILFLLSIAGIFANWDWQHPHSPFKAMVLLLVPSFLYLALPETLSILQYQFGFWLLLASTHPSWRHMRMMVPATLGLAVAVVLWIVHTPHRLVRIASWLAPGSDPLGSGYPIEQASNAIHQAGPWGQGLTTSLPVLPEAASEFIFAYLIFTLGWVAGIAIALLCLFLLVRMWHVSARIQDRFGRNLIIALLAVFSLHYGLNLLMNLGMIPVLGVDLPLISYGGRQAVYLAMAGLALGVYRRRHWGTAPILQHGHLS